MTPKDRVRLYAKLAALGAVAVWLLLCFLILVSPKSRRLGELNGDVNESKKQLADMKREIEDASIAGPPPVGTSRFEKFGILGVDEEQLFLSDLIDFCKETNNTLNLVRRADVARPTRIAAEEGQQKGGRGASGSQSSGGDASEVPQPVIERVPHNVSYSGTFLSSFYLLRALESYKRLLTVERMEVTTDSQLGYPRVNGTITIDLYLVKNVGLPVAPTAGETTGAGAGSGGQQTASEGE